MSNYIQKEMKEQVSDFLQAMIDRCEGEHPAELFSDLKRQINDEQACTACDEMGFRKVRVK